MKTIVKIIKLLVCATRGHKDIVTFYNPISGVADSGIMCVRCGDIRISHWGSIFATKKVKGGKG